MLNKIWFWLLVIGIVYGLGKSLYVSLEKTPPASPAGQATPDEPVEVPRPVRDMGQALTNAAIDSAKIAIELCIVLIGVMALWLGMLNIARDAGMVDAFARGLRPLMRWLFPSIPSGHPAEGAMLMNISANVLGLGNAATPFGLKAMRELQTLNPTNDTATNAMAMFLAINTSSVTLVPFTIIALRAASGSASPARPLAGIIMATTISTTVAIIACRLLEKLPGYRMGEPGGQPAPARDESPKEGDV